MKPAYNDISFDKEALQLQVLASTKPVIYICTVDPVQMLLFGILAENDFTVPDNAFVDRRETQ